MNQDRPIWWIVAVVACVVLATANNRAHADVVVVVTGIDEGLEISTQRLTFRRGSAVVDIATAVEDATYDTEKPMGFERMREARTSVTTDLKRLIGALVGCVESGTSRKPGVFHCSSPVLAKLAHAAVEQEKARADADPGWTQLRHYMKKVGRSEEMNLLALGASFSPLGIAGFGCALQKATSNRCVVIAEPGQHQVDADADADADATPAGRRLVAPPGLQTASGEPIEVSSWRGKTVVMVFAASWCDPCLALLEDIDAFAAKAKRRDTIYVGIMYAEEKYLDAAQKAVAKLALRGALRIAYLPESDEADAILDGYAGRRGAPFPLTLVAAPSTAVTARVEAYENFRKRDLPLDQRLPREIIDAGK